MYPILLIILFSIYTIISWRNLKLGLILLAGFLPIYLLRFTIGPIPTTALEIFILIDVAIWILKLRHKDFQKNIQKKYSLLQEWIKPAILLLGVASISTAIAPDIFSALGIWKAYFIEPILVAIMMVTIFNKKDFESVIKVSAISSIFLSITGILQYITGLGIPTPWDIELRITSVFDYPNAFGLFLAPLITISFIKIRESYIYIISALLGTIAIVLSQTEAALVAIPIAILIIFLISNARQQFKFKISFAVISAVIILNILIPAVHEKLLLQDMSGQVRISQWTETAELLKDHFIFGVGLNSYPIVFEQYHKTTLYEIFQYPHNIILNIWTELGLLGLITFFWFAWLILKITWQNKKDPMVLALFAVFLTMFIHGLVDVPYFKNDLAVMSWIFLGALIAQNKKIM